MRILVTGSSGLIGRALTASLGGGGHEVVRLVRGEAPLQRGEFRWRPEAGIIDKSAFEGVDGVVHLAGQSIASGRWTPKLKASIRESRVRGTRLLSAALACCARRPGVLLSASAIGYYGNRGDEPLREESGPGEGFFPEICTAWEEATRAAQEAGVRVVQLRFGIVLSGGGGALQRMLLPFRLGLGGRFGNGRQTMSWVAIEDAIGATCHALLRNDLEGPVNVVAPNPVTNETFTRTLGSVLGRPTIFPLPSALLRLAMGAEMADALLLSSARVLPARLERSGYAFGAPDLRKALQQILDRAR